MAGLNVLLGLTALSVIIEERIQVMAKKEAWLTTGMGAIIIVGRMKKKSV
ncbi:MAG: hypothetical protein JWM44_3192 [Bacilli bacterium]|nr:hypothetical protein [Bacilli bacterium]